MKKGSRTPNGFDLFDLAEFPIALLCEAGAADAYELNAGTPEKGWRMTADPRCGLPAPADQELFVVLQQMSAPSGFHEPIPFSRYDLVQRLHWGTNGGAYQRLDLGLSRWQTVKIHTWNAIHDPQTKQWKAVLRFNVLDSYLLRQHPPGTVPDRETGSWFRWGATMADLLAAGYTARLDVEAYLRLRSPIAQTIYRHLMARFRDNKTLYRQDALTFAQRHIGLDERYLSRVKQKLEGPLEELQEKGLALAHYEPLAAPKKQQTILAFTGVRGRKGGERQQLVQRLQPVATPLPALEPAIPSSPATPRPETPAERSARIYARELAKRG